MRLPANQSLKLPGGPWLVPTLLGGACNHCKYVILVMNHLRENQALEVLQEVSQILSKTSFGQLFAESSAAGLIES